ncbi:MAG: acyltransferase [Chloroflexota bacterium]
MSQILPSDSQASSSQPQSEKIVHIQKSRYIATLLRQNPLEMFRLFHVAWTTAKYRYLFRCVGPGTIVGRWVEIVNTSNVEIGSHCLFQDGVYMRAGNQGWISIADRAALNSYSKLFGHGGIEIGEEAQVGPGSLITTTDHDYYDQNLETTFKQVTIGRRVWLGANVTVLPGVTIGEYAVIGAGAVVNRDIPPYAVAVGVPARVIKYLNDTPNASSSSDESSSQSSNHVSTTLPQEPAPEANAQADSKSLLNE